MPRSLRVRQEWIEKVKLSVRRNGFLSQQALAEEVGMALATIGSFLRGKPVDRTTFVELCDRLSLDCQEIAEPIQELPTSGEESQSPSLPMHSIEHQDRGEATISWGEAIDVSAFYGREEELSILERWVVDDHCRLITLTGIGGIGKTALSVKLAEEVQTEFEVVIWRSLRNAPPVQDLLVDLLNVLSRGRQTEIPTTINRQISQLIEHLRTVRCLLILDNAESILVSEERAGAYRVVTTHRGTGHSG